MTDIKVAGVIAKILKEEGVQWYSGVHGGHVWQLMMAISRVGGIKMYHMRHEQSAAYAADGWGRVTKRPGICFATAGPGLANLVPGICQAYHARSPVICLVGQHGTLEDEWGPFQEAYAEPMLSHFTKWTKRIIEPSMAAYFMQKAFRDAMSYPPGPIVIEIPSNILGAVAGDESSLRGYLEKGRCAAPEQPAGNPQFIEKAVGLLLEAKRPVVIGGDGIYWSGASEELKEFIELLNIPVITRRMGRGAVSEEHPLSFSGAIRSKVQVNADVIAIFGLRMNMLEGFGLPPKFPVENVKYIQVAEDIEELTTRLVTDISIIGSPKQVLRQMINCAKELIKDIPDRDNWLSMIDREKRTYRMNTKEVINKVRNNKPIHPDFLAAEIVDYLDKDATIILDSFSMSGFITDKIEASFAGQILDAATWGGVGHGVGMGIGAQLGRPGKQVLVLLGDGGLGVAGFDIETAARYKIPVCYFLFNNSSWIGNLAQKLIVPDVKDSWGMLPNIRYDKIFTEMDCHTEFVTEPTQIKPALERAFNSGRTSLINVIPDNNILPPQLGSRIEYYQKLFGSMGG